MYLIKYSIKKQLPNSETRVSCQNYLDRDFLVLPRLLFSDTIASLCYNAGMKKVAIGFAIGFATAVLSLILGLMTYANDPLVPQERATAIPGTVVMIGLTFKGFAIIFVGAFFLGLLVVAINWAITGALTRRKSR